MGSMCHSLFRFCCEAQDSSDEHRHLQQHGHQFLETGTMSSARMTHRSNSPTAAIGSIGDAYQHPAGVSAVAPVAGVAPPLEGGSTSPVDSARHASDRNDETVCCRPQEPHAQGIHDFFRRLMRDRWRPSDQSYDIMRQGSEDSHDNEHEDDDAFPTKKPIPPSPLRPALNYDTTKDIPCIHADEIVMPGSLLQKEMAKQMMSAKLTESDVECVICMEGFDPTNPRMPTLCGCGENKTFFHLPCLYQWLEQSRDCPSCRSRLAWEEF